MIRLDGHRDQAGAHEIIEAARGHLAFDIGANIGTTARVLAEHFATVVALEPCAESFMVLLEETPPNVVCVDAAASDHVGVVSLSECEGSIRSGQLTTGTGLSWGAEVGSRAVQATTVDALIAHYGKPQFVKIDVEGHEVKVLEGWADVYRCDVLIEVHAAANEFAVRRMWGQPLRKLEHAESVGAATRRNHFWLTSVGA